MIINYINNYLWGSLWIIILGVAILGYFYFKKLQWQPATLTHQEKSHNNQFFFISMAGSIGLGNVFVVITEIQKYGGGIILWLWIGALIGRYLKFWELFLSLKSKKNHDDFTGPILYIKTINTTLSWIFGLLSIFYYMEIYQFNILVQLIYHSTSSVWSLSPTYGLYGIGLLLFFFIYWCRNRSTYITSSNILMRIFLWGYFGFLVFLSIKYYYYIPSIIKDIINNLWQGSWSHKLLVVGIGIRTSIYCNDIGVGYEGIIQKYSHVEGVESKQIQYCYTIINSNTMDMLVCTTSALIALFYSKIFPTSWAFLNPLSLIINIFNLMMGPWGHWILTILIFSAGFTTLCTLFQSGSLIINYFKPHWPSYSFYIISFPIFIISLSYNLDSLFSFITLGGGLLVMINGLSIGYILIKGKYKNINHIS